MRSRALFLAVTILLLIELTQASTSGELEVQIYTDFGVRVSCECDDVFRDQFYSSDLQTLDSVLYYYFHGAYSGDTTLSYPEWALTLSEEEAPMTHTQFADLDCSNIKEMIREARECDVGVNIDIDVSLDIDVTPWIIETNEQTREFQVRIAPGLSAANMARALDNIFQSRIVLDRNVKDGESLQTSDFRPLITNRLRAPAVGIAPHPFMGHNKAGPSEWIASVDIPEGSTLSFGATRVERIEERKHRNQTEVYPAAAPAGEMLKVANRTKTLSVSEGRSFHLFYLPITSDITAERISPRYFTRLSVRTEQAADRSNPITGLVLHSYDRLRDQRNWSQLRILIKIGEAAWEEEIFSADQIEVAEAALQAFFGPAYQSPSLSQFGRASFDLEKGSSVTSEKFGRTYSWIVGTAWGNAKILQSVGLYPDSAMPRLDRMNLWGESSQLFQKLVSLDPQSEEHQEARRQLEESKMSFDELIHTLLTRKPLQDTQILPARSPIELTPQPFDWND